MAKASAARAKSGAAGALDGIPLGIKDLFCTKDVRTTACSLFSTVSAAYESTVTAQSVGRRGGDARQAQ